MASKFPHPANEAAAPAVTARIRVSPDEYLTVQVSPGCERFIGRFARLPELRFGDGIIYYRNAAEA